jgi:hypothetical protein
MLMASLLGHHAIPKPIALLSITGIPTFQHRFFRSSTLLTPEALTEADMARHLNGPVEIGTPETNGNSAFYLGKLTSEGKANRSFMPPMPVGSTGDDCPRGYLYDYYLYWNKYPDMVREVDPGFGTPDEPPSVEFRKAWPTTIIIQGDDDYDVSMDVSSHMADSMGEDKVKLFLAAEQGHLFEHRRFIEDIDVAMNTVREAVKCLDSVVQAALV